MAESGRIKKQRSNFSMVSNYCALDKKLSLKAKGLYLVIQAYIDIPNFVLYKSFLMKNCMEGERAFNSAWKELKEAGYLVVNPGRDENGAYIYEYELKNKRYPDMQNAGTDNARLDNSLVDNSELDNSMLKKDVKEQNIQNNINNQSIQIESSKYQEELNHELMDRWTQSNYHYLNHFNEFYKIYINLLSNEQVEFNYLTLKEFTYDLINKHDLIEQMNRYFTYPNNPGAKIIDELVEIMIDIFQGAPDKKVVIGTHSKNRSVVINKLLQLDFDKMERLIYTIIENTSEIKNPNAYLKTCLYNAAASQGMASTYLQNR